MSKVLDTIAQYYASKLKEHGATAKGVDWNSEESQQLRFNQVLKVINVNEPFSLLDYGCGFGSMHDFMKSVYKNFKYSGFDISRDMIEVAKKIDKNDCNWYSDQGDIGKHDFVISSGIFNVKLETDTTLWKEYIIETLHNFDRLAEKGFSFNMLTKYSDKEHMKDHLYYVDPCFVLDYCKTHFSKHVAILHDYPLYEFTVVVRKNI